MLTFEDLVGWRNVPLERADKASFFFCSEGKERIHCPLVFPMSREEKSVVWDQAEKICVTMVVRSHFDMSSGRLPGKCVFCCGRRTCCDGVGIGLPLRMQLGICF